MEEYGGLLLYEFVSNNSIQNIDFLGLATPSVFETWLRKFLQLIAGNDVDKAIGLLDILADQFAKLTPQKAYDEIAARADFSKETEIQKDFLKNYLGLMSPRKDPYEMTLADVVASRIVLNMKTSHKFLDDVATHMKTHSTFNGEYDINAGARLTATLGQFTAKTKVSGACFPANKWAVTGTFTVQDTYDFNYDPKEARRALQDFLNGTTFDQGSYEGRSCGGEIKTVLMSKAKGQSFKVTSVAVPFKQTSDEDEATINPQSKK